MALSYLMDAFGEFRAFSSVDFINSFSTLEQQGYERLLAPGNKDTPFARRTSSVGRLFDAVAAIIGVCHLNTFEGEAAIKLEAAAMRGLRAAPQTEIETYTFSWAFEQSCWQIDQRPVIREIVHDLVAGVETDRIAIRFHNAVANALQAALTSLQTPDTPRSIALTGGVFANSLLLRNVSQRLTQAGFEVLRQTRLPAGDGGISLGQLAVAAQCHKEQLLQPIYYGAYE